MKKEIIQNISNLDKELGRNDINIEIFLPEEIYSGSKLDYLPDIMFTINNWRCIIEENDINKAIFIDKPYSIRHTGTHRLNGIFVANGPQIKKGKKLQDVRIYDIFPTILYLMGYSVPENDGKILYEIFKESIKSNKHYIKNKTGEKKSEIDKEAEEKIKERLKGLGYL